MVIRRSILSFYLPFSSYRRVSDDHPGHRPRKNQWAVTYTTTGVAFAVRTINLSGRDGNVLGFKTMRVMGVLE